jgi:hypothetical protein
MVGRWVAMRADERAAMTDELQAVNLVVRLVDATAEQMAWTLAVLKVELMVVQTVAWTAVSWVAHWVSLRAVDWVLSQVGMTAAMTVAYLVAKLAVVKVG